MAAPAAAQVTAGTVLLPPGYDSTRIYPVVVFLPATSATSEHLLNSYLQRIGQAQLIGAPREHQAAGLLRGLFPGGSDGREFLLVLAGGQAGPADYASGDAWIRTIDRFEQGVRGDIAALAATRRIDTTRVVLAGFSLGGDLAWALALRNPAAYRGAVVMSSRATYRAPPAGYRALTANGSRFFLTMGSDDTARLPSARAAIDVLDALRVPNQFREVPGAGHAAAPPELLAEGIAFVLDPL